MPPRSPSRDDSSYDHERVRRWVQPYPWRDWLRVVHRNLTQHPTFEHATSTNFVRPDTVIDDAVVPSVRVGFLGDLMPVGRRSFSLGPDAAALVRQADHLVVNFEGSLWSGPGRPPKVFAAQHHHDLRVLETLAAELPPDRIVVSVANNHAADFGWRQHLSTCDAIEAAGFRLVGTKAQPGIRLGPDVHLAAATRWTNQAHTYLPFVGRGEDPLADGLFDPDAPCNVLVPHWGFEHELYPRPGTIELAHGLLDRWDAIVAHHPHVPGPVSAVDHGGRPRLVAWSLGQASSSLTWPIYRHGIALLADLGPRPDGSWSVGSASWRFVALDQPDDDSVVLDVRPSNRWFPTEREVTP